MLLGTHVSISGGIHESVRRAQSLGCTAMQIFARDPQRWRKTELTADNIRLFTAARAASSIKKVFIHIPYLINLASPKKGLYKSSIRAYVQDMKEAEALGAEYIVTHMGSHTGAGEKHGIKRFTGAINKILDKTRDSDVMILLENTAGAGSYLGYTFAHHKAVIAGASQPKRLGVCLDTCHAYAAGYDISTSAGYKKLMAEIDDAVGLERLFLVHCNDTRDPLGSRRDRHEHIGKGNIGLDGFRRIIRDKRLKHATFVLETPKDSPSADRRNLRILRKLAE